MSNSIVPFARYCDNRQAVHEASYLVIHETARRFDGHIIQRLVDRHPKGNFCFYFSRAFKRRIYIRDAVVGYLYHGDYERRGRGWGVGRARIKPPTVAMTRVHVLFCC